MSSDNVVQFSDLVKNKLGATSLAKTDVGTDEDGNTVINADMGPLEVSVYTSHHDGALVVQIDYPVAPSDASEQPSLRVYFNDSTIYPETTDESMTDSESESEN